MINTFLRSLTTHYRVQIENMLQHWLKTLFKQLLRILLMASSIILWESISMAQFFPMIQTHTMEMEPYTKRSQDYALFIWSQTFSGKEIVPVSGNKVFSGADTGTKSRVLNQFSGQQWFISDQDRVIRPRFLHLCCR